MVGFITFLGLALSLPALVASAPGTKAAMRVHEQRTRVPHGFVAVQKVDADTSIQLRLGLQERDKDGLIDTLYRVSDPASEDYGKHLSKEEANSFLSPTAETLSAVTSWLVDNGIQPKSASPAGDWLEFTMSATEANKLFDADFTVFKHVESNTQAIRTLKYSVPVPLQSHIQLLYPGISFWSTTTQPRFTAVSTGDGVAEKRQVPANCNPASINPKCLQALYGIPATPVTRPANSTIGVPGYIEQYANQQDLQAFLGAQRPDIPTNTTFSTQFLDGGMNPQDINQAGIEANLDVQYTVAVATGAPVTFISVGSANNDSLSGFLDLANFLLGAPQSPPTVMTTSYGANEGDVSSALANKLCTAYASLGTRGTSILYASGDGGVSGSQSQTCLLFVPTFPSGCPFVTSVGATTGIPETAANFSSGGFSNYFSVPSYQASAVTAYKSQSGLPLSIQYNNTGRGFPDVSAIGNNILIRYRGANGLVAGTSASSPIFASVIALINSRRAAVGKSVLGFLNPFLYANPGAFNDIRTGSNPGCLSRGFPARTGWDPVTGLGTPNFPALAAAAGV